MSSTLAFTKLSALFFYRRIFCVGNYMRYFNLATIFSIVTVGFWLVTFEFLAGFECGTHFAALWDGAYAQYCTLSFPYLYGLAVSDFLLDIWILALPIPVILRLHTNRTRKLSVTGLFLLAFIGLGASIARMVLVITVENRGASYLFGDQERVDTLTNYLSMLEAGMSLVAVNLPSLWLLLTTMIPEQVVQSVRSTLSLHSLRPSDPDVISAPAGSSTTRLNRKTGASSSTDSGRPAIISDLSPSRFHPQRVGQQLRDDLDGRMFETYAMHEAGSKRSGEQAWMLQGVIHVENTLELGHEEILKGTR
ncbi:hypothetical protein MMC27_002056 [Xylographa pallens]|nr:hypothetical protein [Xylographa pallens]